MSTRRSMTMPAACRTTASLRRRKPVVDRRHDDPDVVMMLRVRDDDGEAFSDLLGRYWSRIFGHFIRMLTDRQEAEDMTQDVFLRLYRSRKSYKPRARFATWLFHITQNVGRNALRTRRRRPCVYLEALAGREQGGAAESLLFDECEPPPGAAERTEAVQVVRSAVAGLAERQRTAVELHQFEDWTYSEVADEMDMSPEAAKSLLYRARNQLRESLAGYMAEA